MLSFVTLKEVSLLCYFPQDLQETRQVEEKHTALISNLQSQITVRKEVSSVILPVILLLVLLVLLLLLVPCSVVGTSRLIL